MFGNLENEKVLVGSNGWTFVVDGQIVLTVAGKIEITNMFATGSTVTAIKHTLFVPLNLIKAGIKKNKQIEVDCRMLMNGETKPLSLQGLKDACYALHNECDLSAFDNVIDKIVLHSKKDGSGDWDFYSVNIIVNEEMI